MTATNDFLAKASELMTKAENEKGMIMRAVYESLAQSYLRLAESVERDPLPEPTPMREGSDHRPGAA
jgi:hypothetical protein